MYCDKPDVKDVLRDVYREVRGLPPTSDVSIYKNKKNQTILIAYTFLHMFTTTCNSDKNDKRKK